MTKKQMAQHYEDNLALIYKATIDAARIWKLDSRDLIGEARRLFVVACTKYEPNRRTTLRTLLYTVLRNGLYVWCQKQIRFPVTATMPEQKIAPRWKEPDRMLMRKEWMQEAALVLGVLMRCPIELLEGRQSARRWIVAEMYRAGWSPKRTRDLFKGALHACRN